MKPSTNLRFLGLLLFAIALLAVACGSDDDRTGDNAGDDASAQDALVAVDNADTDQATDAPSQDDGDGDAGDNGQAAPDDQTALAAYLTEFATLTAILETRIKTLAATGAGAQSGSLAAAAGAVADFGADLNDLTAPPQLSALHADAVRATAAFAGALDTAVVSAGGVAISDTDAVNQFGRTICALVDVAAQNDIAIDFACADNGLPDLLTQITQVIVELPGATDPGGDDPRGGDTDTTDPAFDTEAPPDLVAVGGAGRAAVGTGSYCWSSGDVGICADSIGIITSTDALVLAPGDAVSMLGLLDWRRVRVENAQIWSAPDAPIEQGPDWIAWGQGDDARGIDVTVNSDGLHFSAPDGVGTYIVSVFLRVPQGDVLYGLLLDVQQDLVRLDQPFQLPFGTSVRFGDADVTISFDAVLEDSRCPSGVLCVWEGRGVVMVSAVTGDIAGALRMELPPGGSAQASVGEYTLTALALDPPARSDAPIAQGDYVLTLQLGSSAAAPPLAAALDDRGCAERFPAGLETGQAVAEAFACIGNPPLGAPLAAGTIVVTGFSAGAFESSIVVQLTLSDGTVLDATPVQVLQPEIGLFVGPWTATLTVPAGLTGQTGAIEAFAISPRDGAIAFGGAILIRFQESSAPPPLFPTVEALAPIESVELLILESFPPQYNLLITSGLPSGCAEFSRYDVQRVDDTTIAVQIWNLVPAPDSLIACTAIYGLVDTTISLGSDFVSGVTYTVTVNDFETTFDAQ